MSDRPAGNEWFEETETPVPHRIERIHSALRRGFASAGNMLTDLIVPPLCLACGDPVAAPHSLCGRCWSKLTLIERPYCERLGIPFGHDPGLGALSLAAIAEPPPYHRARAVAAYDEIAKRLVHDLKYRDRGQLAVAMAGWMVRAGAELLAEGDLIVPIPLHRFRLWRRRYNQAALLAHQIGKRSGVAVATDALCRIKRTRQQVGLSARERADNVRGAFRVPADKTIAIAGRNIVLVDDVLTSGATAAAATRALLRAKAARVDLLVFARVVDGSAGVL